MVVSQIISISQAVNNFRYFGVLAEMVNKSQIFFTIRITDVLVNNLFKPDIEIIEKIEINQNEGERLLLYLNLKWNQITLVYIREKTIIIRKIQEQEKKKTIELNYPDPIHTISASLEEGMFILVQINILLANWQVEVIDFSEPYSIQQIIQYNQKYFQDKKEIRIKKVIYTYDNICILTENSDIYYFTSNERPSHVIEKKENKQILDIVINRHQQTVMLIRVNNTCSVEQFRKNIIYSINSFDCFTNDLQLNVDDDDDDDDDDDLYVLKNHSTILWLSTNTTQQLDQDNYLVIRKYRMFVTYGNNSDIQFIQQQVTPKENQTDEYEKNKIKFQSEVIEYQLNQSENNFKLPVYLFGGFYYNYLLQLHPYLYGPPFSVEVIRDDFSLIRKVNCGQKYETCLSSTEPYQFLKFITKFRYIYQQNNDIYYVVCRYRETQIQTHLRRNQQIIKFCSVIVDNDAFLIYFDDINGKELHYYESFQVDTISFFGSTTFDSPINLMQKQQNSIILQHLNLSKTIIPYRGLISLLKYNQSVEIESFEFVAQLNEFLLCAQNQVSEKMATLFIFHFQDFYIINRYEIFNSSILDLKVIQQNQFMLILKSSIDQVTSLNHYQLLDGFVLLLRQLPNFKMQPQKIVEEFQNKFIVSSLDYQGNPFILVYDLTKNNSECFLIFLPFPEGQFWLSKSSLDVLNTLEENKTTSTRSIQRYQLSDYLIQINEIIQTQFIQNYNVTLQINNLIHQDEVILQIIGHDYTQQLYVKKSTLGIDRINQFQKINFNEYVYGTINSVICKSNCSLKGFAQIKSIYSFEILRRMNGKYVFLMGNYILIFQKQMNRINIVNIAKIVNNSTMVELEEINLIQKLDVNFHIAAVFQLIDSQLQKLMVAICIDNNGIFINTYIFQSEFIQVNQLNLESIYQQDVLSIKIKDNILVINHKNQLVMYQYNFDNNQFDFLQITYHIVESQNGQDHHLYNNILYCAFLIEDFYIKIITLDLTRQSLIFESKFKIENERFVDSYQHIQILDITDDYIRILYFKKIHPQILHFYQDAQGILSMHIQKLILQSFQIVQVLLVYFDKNIILFSMLQLDEKFQNQQSFTSIYLINQKENNTFASQVIDPIDYIFFYQKDKLLFLNETEAGEIQFSDSYEIQINAEHFEIEVSNFKNTLNITLNTSKDDQQNDLKAEITLILSTIGLLVLICYYCVRRNRMKYYQNIN